MNRVACFVVIAMGCASSPPPPPERTAPEPPPRAAPAKVFPTDAELASAPECVRKVAQLRRAVELKLKPHDGGTGSLPSLGPSWSKMRDGEGTFVPMGLDRDWDEKIGVTIALNVDFDDSANKTLEAVGFEIGGGVIGRMVMGSIPLHELACLAEVPIVKRIELIAPSRVHLD